MNPLRYIVTKLRERRDKRLRAQADAVLPEILALLENGPNASYDEHGFCFIAPADFRMSRPMRRMFSTSDYECWFHRGRLVFLKRWVCMNPHLVAPIKAYIALRS